MAKRKKQDKAGDADGGAPAEVVAGPRALRLADHPRATGQIRTVRSWVSLVAFLVVLVFSLRAGASLEDGLLRAMEAGAIGYLIAWAAMVVAWRQLAQAEIESARRRIVAAMLELEAAGESTPTRPAA
ncbi:hypothetical protein DSM112329_00079 [Paraconexibacter sp. AEG42_29]|uniref:CcmD family protein n=1 Tax=Paraconexibacter sp. AEG42_29 TaxID=2997339 RepID=A0AAU7ANQ3_9ACTN